MRKIANIVGISEAAIYKHYKSKKEIITSLIDKLFEENIFYEKINEHDDPFTALKSIMEEQFSYLEKNPKITTILFQEEIFREYPEIKNKFIKVRDKREKILINFLCKAQREGKVSSEVDAQSFALLYMGSIRISVLRWKNKNFSYSLQDKVEPISKTLLKMLKKYNKNI